MNKLIEQGYSLVDYEGDIEGFHRVGDGAQDWADFCRYEGRFLDNMLHGSGKLIIKKFPLVMKGLFEENSLSQGQIDIDNGAATFEGALNEDLTLGSGVITFKDDCQLHLVISEKKIQAFEFFVKQEKINKEEFLKENVFRYTLNRTNSIAIELNLNSSILAYGGINGEGRRVGSRIIEMNPFHSKYWIKSFKNGEAVGSQLELDLSPSNFQVKASYLIGKEELSLLIAYPNGKMIRREGKENKATMYVKGGETYISGYLNQNNEIDGAAELVLDGKYLAKCEVSGPQITFDSSVDLLKSIEKVRQQIFEEIDDKKLNGYHEYKFHSGLVYKGYFLNDFVYCHKDSLPSSLFGLYNDKRPEFEEFFGRVKTFEGLIENQKIISQAKVIYKTGEIYTGYYNDLLQREGDAMQIEPDGKIYIGEFERDVYNGIGKMISKNKFDIGFYRDGKLIIALDIDNMGAGVLNSIKNRMKDAQGGDMTGEELQGMLEQDHYPTPNEELEKVKKRAEEELAMKVFIDDQRKKKMAEEQKVLNDLSQKIVVDTIFSFKNKYSYHGRVMGNHIVDHDEGEIIDPSGRRIPVKYKALNDMEVGTFKSKDNKHIFVFKYSARILADIEIDIESLKEDTPKF